MSVYHILLVISVAGMACAMYLGGPDLEKRAPGAAAHRHGPRARMPLNEDGGEPKKRPFCNAFTGCGRKRSQLPPLTGVDLPVTGGAMATLLGSEALGTGNDVEESLGTLLDLSAEPAVEDLSRQIMSEAKLWEAIQEANMEIMRQRELQRQEMPPAGTDIQVQLEDRNQQGPQGQQGQIKCALPSCIAL